MTSLKDRIVNSWKWRVNGIPAHPVDPRTEWEKKRDDHYLSLAESDGQWRYFEMLREHASQSFMRHRILPLFSLPLLYRSQRIVELGSSFTYYPEGYTSPWGVTADTSEGLVSTRVLLTACRMLESIGVGATVTSVDVRDDPLFERGKKLLTELGLIKYWRPCYGTDSIEWLKTRSEPIDFAFVDSNHTYHQVHNELEALEPLMSDHGVIAIDNWLATNYQTGVEWCPGDDENGIRRGGEYGAILEFLRDHPRYRAEWYPMEWDGVCFLFRRLD